MMIQSTSQNKIFKFWPSKACILLNELRRRDDSESKSLKNRTNHRILLLSSKYFEKLLSRTMKKETCFQTLYEMKLSHNKSKLLIRRLPALNLWCQSQRWSITTSHLLMSIIKVNRCMKVCYLRWIQSFVICLT